MVAAPAFRLPPLASFSLDELWQSLLLAGFAQLPLTATNAIIATSALIGKYWPEKRVSENRLAFNHGVMNLVLPFFGGMPMCHGAGGLAGQYYFGARTGGTNIIEGVLELFFGLFPAGSIASLFVAFPSAIIGGMMLLVGVELTKFARDIRLSLDLISLSVTVAVAVLTNMAFGFAAGTATAGVAFLASLIANRVKTGRALIIAGKRFLNLLPAFLTMLAAVSIVHALVPQEMIIRYLGSENRFLATLAAALVGAITFKMGGSAVRRSAVDQHTGHRLR